MPLETHIENAKQLANENDTIALIREVIEHPQIYVFGELIEEENIKSIQQSVDASKWYNLLELFAYGKLSDYNEQNMPPLTDSMIKKLRLLTIITLANNKSKKIPYSVLGEELKINNLRDLEDLIIEAIYANLVKGKLDQKANCLEVDSTLARDVRMNRIDDISSVLTSWITNCENILANIEKQSRVANSIKAENLTKKVELDNYISTIKKTIKANNQEMDEAWEINSMQHHEYEKSKRLFKPNFRNSSKNKRY